MKALITTALLAFLCVGSRAQQLTPPELTPPTLKPPPLTPRQLTPPQLTPSSPPPASPFPLHLKPAFDVLAAMYPKLDSKKAANSPADSAWLLRSNRDGIGTVEIGFQNADVIYMIFRRGVGGRSWTQYEVMHLHRLYSRELLKEPEFGELFNCLPAGGVRALPTRAAYIYRQDFDVSSLMDRL